MLIKPAGYRYAAVSAGFKKAGRADLGLVVSDTPATAAGVFTTNRFQAAPVLVAKELLSRRQQARAVLINAGQANACTGDPGLADCRATLDMVGKAVPGLDAADILPASTGVIGVRMPLDRWAAAAPELAAALCTCGPIDFARAIMTTDQYPKIAWAEAEGIKLLGVAKGAGMICPNMATMLVVLLCDAVVEPALWQDLVAKATASSFNAITVDGDTSTNDAVLALANGASGVAASGSVVKALADALGQVCQELATLIVEDAEGGTKVIAIHVRGATDDAAAERVARTVGNSPLVKTAFYGRDANWGRIVAAVGRSGASFDPDQVSVSIAGLCLFSRGTPVDMDFDSLLKPALRRPRVEVDIAIGQGPGQYSLLASDLTHEYVNINADYRS